MMRTKIILVVAALLVAMLAAFAGPAMADTQRCNVHDNHFANCNGDRFVNPDRFFFDDGFRNAFFFDNCGEEIGGIFFDIAPFNDCGFNGFDGIHNGVFQSVG